MKELCPGSGHPPVTGSIHASGRGQRRFGKCESCGRLVAVLRDERLHQHGSNNALTRISQDRRWRRWVEPHEPNPLSYVPPETPSTSAGCGHCGKPGELDVYPDCNGRRLHAHCYSAVLAERERGRINRITAHGITVDEHDQMLEKQGGLCAACGDPPLPGRVLCIDHDHACCPGSTSCGKCVRGLLCDGCNCAAGHLRDRARAARGLAKYLAEMELRQIMVGVTRKLLDGEGVAS